MSKTMSAKRTWTGPDLDLPRQGVVHADYYRPETGL